MINIDIRRSAQMDTETKDEELHFFLFPFMAQGHTIPFINMAKLFATRGVRVSLITTPVNAPGLSESIESFRISGHKIEILTIKFPCVEAGLPKGCEHVDLIPSPEMTMNFFEATFMLARPLEKLLMEFRPSCLVSDGFFPWSSEVASKCGVPRIVFGIAGFFSSCAVQCVRLYEPYKNVNSDEEPFTIPNFPGQFELTRKQLQDYVYQETEFSEFCRKFTEAEINSYGVLMNTFYELEPTYVDHFRNFFGAKAWHIGPISLWNESDASLNRGKEASIRENEILEWLDSKKPNSVVYICFGSNVGFTDEQLLELANGIEESGQDFIWVVKKRSEKYLENEEKWLPPGFEERMDNKGLIIRGWAPQVLILDHEAVGGFVSHCGWNSTLEAITSGVKMVTWPISAEQFYNEKLVTEVLRIGVRVGAKKWVRKTGDYVKKEAICKAVRDLMVGDEAEAMSSRAKKYAEMARKAVENGGSSHSDVSNLIDEFKRKHLDV